MHDSGFVGRRAQHNVTGRQGAVDEGAASAADSEQWGPPEQWAAAWDDDYVAGPAPAAESDRPGPVAPTSEPCKRDAAGVEADTATPPGVAQAHQEAQGPEGMPTQGEFTRLTKAANRGDKQALAALRDLLDRNEVWTQAGNLAALTEAVLVHAIAGDDALASATLTRTLQDMKARLIRPDADYLEQLAVERLVAAWAQRQLSEALLTKSEAGTPPARFWLRRHDSATREYDRATKMLTTLQRIPAAKASGGQPAQQAAAVTQLVADRPDGGTIPFRPHFDSADASHMCEARAAGS